jgi:hypothetical protein
MENPWVRGLLSPEAPFRKNDSVRHPGKGRRNPLQGSFLFCGEKSNTAARVKTGVRVELAALTAAQAWDKNSVGQSSESPDREVMPMEQFLLDVLATIVAGVLVALIVRRR